MSKKSKRIILIAACVLVVAGAITGIVLGVSAARRARTTIVGFYDVDESYQTAVLDVLERAFTALYPVAEDADAATEADRKAPTLQFLTLTDEQAADSKLTKKIDVLITQTGALTTSLMTKAVAESADVAARFPRTTQQSPYFSLDGRLVVMPLFLDHFETAYYTILEDKLGVELPSSLYEFAEYADWARESVTYPIIAAGENDTVLFSMISALVESVAGAEGYRALADDLMALSEKGSTFDEALGLQLKGDTPYGITFGDIIRVLKNWRDSGLMLGNWYETKEATIRVFMEDYHTGIVEMMLSQHRRMPYPMIMFYDVTQFPADTSINRALIAPSVSCMLFKDSAVTRAFADMLSSADEQDFLSMSTQLAPATSRGQSYDIQADDVRFLAAASAGGPVPELGTAAFISVEKRKEFAAWIRGKLI